MVEPDGDEAGGDGHSVRLPGLGFFGGSVRLGDAWEWYEWILGIVGSDGRGITLRRLLQRFDGIYYYDRMRAAVVSTATYNVNRDTEKHPDPVDWRDDHPEHACDDKIAMAEMESGDDPDIDNFMAMFGARK